MSGFFDPFGNSSGGGGGASSKDEVARAEIAAIKDGETLDSFGDVETVLATKANTSTTYTKTEVDTAMSAKADKSTTYTKTEVDTALADKVDKETGKGLSTNDYTTAEKTKLASIEAQANKTTVDDVLSGSSTNPVQNKVVKSALDSKANISDIPTVPITAIQKNGTGIIPLSGTVNITVPTSAADVSALPDTTKYAAALSLTINSSTFVMTGQLKDQNGDNLGTAQTIDLPLESVVVGGSYNSQTKKVVLTLQNGNTIEFSVADLVSGLQTELSASNKLNPAYINYDSAHRAVSDTEKSTWNGKQNALTTSQLAAANSGINSTKVAQIETNKNNILSKCVYCTCSTSSSTAAKVVVAPTGWVLQNGCIIGVKNTNTNSANSITLNVNSTGAKSIAYGSNTPYTGKATRITGISNHVTYYMYDGTYWCYITTNRIDSEMPQSEATTGTSTEPRLITAKVLSDTIDEKLVPVENNISYNTNNGVKNVLDFQTWVSNCSVVNATKTVGANTINIAAASSNSYTEYLSNYPANTDIKVNEGDIYQLSWTYSRTGGSGRGSIYAYAMDNSNTIITSANAQGTTGKLSITMPTGATKLRISIAVPANTSESYGYMMICPKSLYDADPTYQPYAMNNAELTQTIGDINTVLEEVL